MKQHLLFIISTIMVVGTTCRLIDLSHDHGPKTLMYQNDVRVPKFKRSTIFAGEFLPGIYLEGGQYSSGEHGGTHLDAPAHYQKGGQRIHQIPLENTIAKGVMIDCSAEAAANSSYLVPLQKLLDWEQLYGQIPMQAAVIFNFGWSSKFDTPTLYVGAQVDDEFNYVFPAVSAEAGLWLYDNRDIKIIGTDTLTPDPFTINEVAVTSTPIHQKYLPNQRLIVENLKGPERLPATGFRFHAAPVKYVGNTGTQIRAYAMTNYVFPAVSAEAGLWLYDNRDIKIIGTDTLTPDPFTINEVAVTSTPIHQKYLPNQRLIVENLKGPERLPATGFRFHAAPVKYIGNTGTQIRAYAMTYDKYSILEK